MRFRVCLSESKRPLETFKLSKEFSTKTRITKRTVEVGQAFGIGINEEKRFSIFNDFVVDIDAGRVVLITGDSGAGKSTLLNELAAQMSSRDGRKSFGTITTNGTVKIEDSELIVEGVGKDVSEAISILSMSGLNEAFLMLRKFKELSDGQKYRYRVAKMIDSDSDTWIFDEFAALLDRVTAKCVAYTVQKTARKLGKTLVVATTHEDLLEDLKPDIWIQKKFGNEVSVSQFKEGSFDKRCSLLKEIKIEECDLKELAHLEQFHYRGKVSNLVKKCFRAVLKDETIAGLVMVPPHLQLRGRNIALPEFRGRSDRTQAEKVNKEIVRIARVIVAPKFRSIGLGAEIVRETLPKAGVKYVETLAVMAKYNKFFESAGMKKIDVPEDEKEEKDLRELESLGFRRELLPSRQHVESIVSKLDQRRLEVCRRFALRYCAVAKRRAMSLIPRIKELDREAIIDALKLHSSRPLYLYWQNPLL
ncbi:MAG: ATP-binding cassette domain-containing protein, partial [Nitrososphaerales archaeon]